MNIKERLFNSALKHIQAPWRERVVMEDGFAMVKEYGCIYCINHNYPYRRPVRIRYHKKPAYPNEMFHGFWRRTTPGEKQ